MVEREQNSPTAQSVSRRLFLQRLGLTGAAAAASTALPTAFAAEPPPRADAPNAATGDTLHVKLKINGAEQTLDLEPRAVLLDVLREQLALSGTKKGCDHGQCGACTVLINGRRVLSCLALAVTHAGDEITTIEGLEQDGQLHPVQAAFLAHDGFQCGACTSGQIMSAVGLLAEPVGADDQSVRESMSGNICRCGAYQGILAAVQQARKHRPV